MGFHKILAALDHSSLSLAIFNHALELAETNHARLLLFHCLASDTMPASLPFPGELGLSPHVISQVYQTQHVQLEQETQQTKVMLQRFGELATQRGVPTEYWFKAVDAGPGLCQAAKEWGADLLVMGRRGRRGLTEVLLGSVSNYVLHHAHCAVLVIQSEKEATAPATVEHTEVSA